MLKYITVGIICLWYAYYALSTKWDNISVCCAPFNQLEVCTQKAINTVGYYYKSDYTINYKLSFNITSGVNSCPWGYITINTMINGLIFNLNNTNNIIGLMHFYTDGNLRIMPLVPVVNTSLVRNKYSCERCWRNNGDNWGYYVDFIISVEGL